MTIDMSKVFLILRPATAAVVQTVIQDRLDALTDTECNNPAVRAEMDAECAHLRVVIGQLVEPE
ncbi:hypothetical protein [Massilia sp. GCM10023247]|uniref:hypothetical protein n=1 Tax=Massilia sp. GCM10023247 TaxID=3252643 RepID=UPI00361D28EE